MIMFNRMGKIFGCCPEEEDGVACSPDEGEVEADADAEDKEEAGVSGAVGSEATNADRPGACMAACCCCI